MIAEKDRIFQIVFCLKDRIGGEEVAWRAQTETDFELALAVREVLKHVEGMGGSDAFVLGVDSRAKRGKRHGAVSAGGDTASISGIFSELVKALIGGPEAVKARKRTQGAE